jgi:hypothetical protein
MSDEHEPGTPPTQPGDEHEQPHGVVETLREELHEVVEHVPQPVRWTVGKLVRVALLSLAALVVLAVLSTILYLANRTELVAHELTLVVNHELALHSDLELTIRDIKGNPFSGFRAVEPRVRFRSDGQPLLEADAMRVGYSALGLLRGGGPPIEVVFDRAVVHLDGGPKQTLRLPAWKAGGGPAKEGRPVAFGLTLKGARFEAPQPLGRFAGVDLRISGHTGPSTRVTLEHMRWSQGPWHSRLESLAAELTRDADSVRVNVRELKTGDLDAKFMAAWKVGDDVQVLHADVRRVRWRWLAEVFDNDEFAVPGEGHVRAEATHGERWLGRAAIDGAWDSLAVALGGRVAWNGKELQIDELAGRSLAGNVEGGRLRWSRLGWVLTADAKDADPSHWHALRLDGWPQGKLNGAFRYALDSRGRTNNSRLDARLASSEWEGWNVDSALVHVDFPAVARDSFTVRGWRRGGRFTLEGRVTPQGWGGPYVLDAFPLEEWPDGRASGLRGTLAHGEGTVESRKGSLFVTGDLAGGVTDWSAAHFARWQLRHVEGQLLPRPDLTAQLLARDGFFVGVHLDSVDAALKLGDQQVAYTPAHAVAGDTVFTGTGSADWSGARWRTRLTSASATSRQFAWKAEPPLDLSGDAQGTLFDRVVANDGAAHLQASGRWAAPGGYYDFSLAGTDLELGRLGMPAPWGLAGRASGRLDVTGRSGDPRWTFEAHASAPGFSGHRCDTMLVALAGQPHVLEVRDFLFGLDRGSARGHGRVTGTVRAFPDSLSSSAIVRWLQDAGSWEGRLEAKRLTISHLGAFAPRAEGWAGVLEGSLAISGSPQHPGLDLDASADDIGWREYRAQRVETHAAYHAGLLEVPQMLVTMQNVASTIRGQMPVTLALGRTPSVPEAPMQWSANVQQGDLKLLPALLPVFQSARGRFDLDASVNGTTHHPRLAGRAHVRDGTVRPAGREEVLQGVYADLHFDEKRLSLDSLTARQGKTGRVWARGGVDLDGSRLKGYAFDLRMRDFASSQEGLYAMLFDGDFKVVDGPRVLGERLPQVLGNVRLKRGVVEFDFANQSEVQRRMATTEPLYWTYRIHVDAASNLRWRPPDGDMEFNADLDLEQTPDSLLIYGEMHLIKGHYFFLSNRFDVTQADVTFDNQKGVDPTLDIAAETRLKLSREFGANWGSTTPSNTTETIYATIQGRSSEPVIGLTSQSGLDQRAILGELTLGRFSSGSNAALSATDPFQNYLTRQLSNQVSRELSHYFHDAVNDWELQRDQGELFGGRGNYVLSVGGDINSRTSWTYRQSFAGQGESVADQSLINSTSLFDRDVELEYRINRFIYATTEVTKRRYQSLQTVPNPTGTDFNINLKARWEY